MKDLVRYGDTQRPATSKTKQNPYAPHISRLCKMTWEHQEFTNQREAERGNKDF